MLSSLTGVLIGIDGATAVLDLGVVTLEAALPQHAAEELAARVGTTVTLHARLTLESPNQGASFTPRLTAFPDAASRACYDLLTGVRGLGGRKALRAMAIPPDRLLGAIAAGDAATLQRLPEIGKKLAQTLITELGEKAAAAVGAAPPTRGATAGLAPGAGVASGPIHDATAALIALGQSPAEAGAAVARAAAALGREPADADELVTRVFGVR